MATRMRKGSRVEVMLQDAYDCRMPPYSWRRGDLLSFNSWQFIVRLDESQVPVQCVRRDCIRPLPPPFVGRFRWKVGNVVEVFEDYAWWPAIVVGVDARRRIFNVCPWNTGREIQVSSFKLRQRKQWIHKQWSLVDEFEYEYRSEAEEEFLVSGGDRAPPCDDDTEFCNVAGRKRRSPAEGEEEELGQRRSRCRIIVPAPAVSSSTSSVDSSPSPN